MRTSKVVTIEIFNLGERNQRFNEIKIFDQGHKSN